MQSRCQIRDKLTSLPKAKSITFKQLNPNWHESKKNARSPKGFFYKAHAMSLAVCQINPIDVNFQLQKSFEIFDKNSAAINQIHKRGSGKTKVSCLMQIKVE